jgi:hypothetical protein
MVYKMPKVDYPDVCYVVRHTVHTLVQGQPRWRFQILQGWHKGQVIECRNHPGKLRFGERYLVYGHESPGQIYVLSICPLD